MLKSIFQHLRFPFSILLMPVFIFALAELPTGVHSISYTILLFIILHVIIYPSSNAFNSLQDDDKGSIGLVKNPLPAPKELRIVTIGLDLAGITLSFFIGWQAALGIIIYIIASRLYSYRPVRLKKYPIIGFLTVFVFQGSWIFMLVQYVAGQVSPTQSLLMGCCASCLIGAVYPLSQIYQHAQDKNDGVVSISYLLGYRGTFLFSAVLFLIGNAIFTVHHLQLQQMHAIYIFNLFQLPVICFFIWWFYRVWNDTSQANFLQTMRMNILSAICMNTCFLSLFIYRPV